MKIKRTSHAAYRVQYHIVWTTRFSKKILVEGVREYLRVKIQEAQEYQPDWEIASLGFGKEHVHLSIEFPPKYSGSYVVETIKKNTSRHLKKKFKFIRKAYWDDGGMWSVGYFFSTLGINEEVIRNYIEHQAREDSGQAKLEF